MTKQSKDASKQAQEVSKRQERAMRILDAASTLILRLGYNKVTLDDVSRQAGVAKATIYLHWKTREALFSALMKREKLELAEDLKQRIATDPIGSTLRGMFKHSALGLMKRPLLKAVLMRDMDILGKLAQSEQSNASYTERMISFKVYLEVLREQHLVRTDLSLYAQVYMLSAIFAGFFLVAPLLPEEYMLADEELAEMLAETVHRTLEPERSESSIELQFASQAFMHYLNQDMSIAQEELQYEIETGTSKHAKDSH